MTVRRIYRDLGDGFVLSSDPVRQEDRELLVGWRCEDGREGPVISGLTVTMEQPDGHRYRVRLPKAGRLLAHVLALQGRHEMVVPGVGCIRARQGTNVGEVVAGDLQGTEVLF